MRRIVPRGLAVVLSAVTGFMAITTAPDVVLPDLSIGEQLETMSKSQRADFLAKHPGLAVQASNANPIETARWWAAKTTAEKAHELKTRPYAVGNLAGVDYKTRDKANRVRLAHALHKARKAARTSHSATATLRLNSLLAIRHAIASNHKPRRHLIALTDDVPALASIAVGDLDRAELVTFAVPGMGTLTTDMALWTQAAQNIYDEQREVGATKKRAVVAWVGYVTPPQGVGAALGSYAQQGSPLLQADIGGVFATHGPKAPKPMVNVVAHSYGTTTAANALYRAPFEIHSFVMVGSAGIETTIPSAAMLEADFVYAAEARRDPLARYGRASRTDPRPPQFGATVFNVDGIPGRDDSHPVTGHEPILHSRWNDNPHSTAWHGLKTERIETRFEQHQRQFGYLDRETQSLYNIAVVTTPGTGRELR